MTMSAVDDRPDSVPGSGARDSIPGPGVDGDHENDALTRILRVLAGMSVAAVFLFLINTYLTFWQGWPGVPDFLYESLEGRAVALGWIQLLFYPAAVAAVIGYVLATPHAGLRLDSARLSELSAFIIRGAFYAVLLIGLVDWVISAVRVEGGLDYFASQWLVDELGRPTFRGVYIHYPLLALSFVIAFFTRNLGFPWLALLIVIAEIQIVLSRFIFSYEQAYMGDLVRFWYAALFLFASAYALPHEGHVRVDVFYARFTKIGKARTNALGSVLLGLPLCWVILTTGLWEKGSTLISPLTSYEISQAGYGLYIKYLMAGFLIVYATSMAVQFTSYFLNAVADLRGEPGVREEEEHSEV